MDLPKKYSSRHLTWVYAFFIFFFTITLSLFFTSRCQKSSQLTTQASDPPAPQEALEKSPVVKKKINLHETQAPRKYAASKSESEAFDEKINAGLSKKTLSDEPKTAIDNLKTLPDKTLNPSVIPHSSPALSTSGRQKAVIYFSDESTGLTDNALKTLRTIFLALLKQPDEKLIIEGYGDSSIISRHNKNLSQSRANIVRDYFVKRGISNSRIKTFWMGSEDPDGVGVLQKDGKKTHQVEVRLN